MRRIITGLLFSATLLVTTNAASHENLNYIDEYFGYFDVCGDPVAWTGLIKVTSRVRGNKLNANLNIVASGIGESNEIYSLTIKDSLNELRDEAYVTFHQTRVRVRNHDMGERYTGTVMLNLVGTPSGDFLAIMNEYEIDECLFR